MGYPASINRSFSLKVVLPSELCKWNVILHAIWSARYLWVWISQLFYQIDLAMLHLLIWIKSEKPFHCTWLACCIFKHLWCKKEWTLHKKKELDYGYKVFNSTSAICYSIRSSSICRPMFQDHTCPEKVFFNGCCNLAESCWQILLAHVHPVLLDYVNQLLTSPASSASVENDLFLWSTQSLRNDLVIWASSKLVFCYRTCERTKGTGLLEIIQNRLNRITRH